MVKKLFQHLHLPQKTIALLFSALLLTTANVTTVNANEVEVVDVKIHQQNDKTWTFAVTLKHDDKGWDHYANEWQVIGADNKIFGTRTLYHPHVNEQPFTRNLSGVKIPTDIKTIRVIAKDTVHGLSHKAAEINLQTKEIKQVTLVLKKAK